MKCKDCNIELLKKELFDTDMFVSVEYPENIPVGFAPNDFYNSDANGAFQADQVTGVADLAVENAQ